MGGRKVGRRATTSVLLLIAVLAGAPPAHATATTTLQRTIQDRDGDNLLDEAAGEGDTRRDGGGGEDYTVLPQGTTAKTYRRPNTASILNFLQLSDFQTVDE